MPSSTERAPRFPVLALLVIAVSVALDQLTKAAAVAWLLPGVRHSYLGDLFRLELVRNPGAFLSLGADLPPAIRSAIFTWGVLVLVLGAAWVALFRARTAAVAVGAALVAGGGVGNLWDRVVAQGLVVDFLNLGIGRLRTGVFNVADLAIVGGAILLAFAPQQKKPEAEGEAGERQG